MKNFSHLYPYLSWWLSEQGYMQLGQGNEYNHEPFLMLIDEGGMIWEDDDSEGIDEALVRAEKYLREEEFPDNFDKETIESIEEDYKKYNLK